jgi:UV DNA damage endonuclease
VETVGAWEKSVFHSHRQFFVASNTRAFMFVVLLRRSRTTLSSHATSKTIHRITSGSRPPITINRESIASLSMPATKRKQSAVVDATANGDAPQSKRRASARKPSAAVVNPDKNEEIIDAPDAMRASPDNALAGDIVPELVEPEIKKGSESPLSDAPDVVEPPKPKRGRGKKAEAEKVVKDISGVAEAPVEAAESKAPVKRGRGKKKEVKMEEHADVASVAASTPAKKTPKKASNGEAGDPEGDEEDDIADPEEVKSAAFRPPAVNSAYLPLPWTGRLGYACLNTYLRTSNPPIFSSRTCRIQSILEHRHPLEHPDQPEHPTKNRPDRSKPADHQLGQRYLEAVCLANVKDISKMVRWNEKFHIRFMRLSSEMFPFASHAEYGYTLAPFASEALAEAGKVVAELNHRVTTHPGQFTQLGSPRQSVIENAIRDLIYHDEMLSLLKLPEQQNRDAVMILHMGGVFEGKAETIERFKENYAKLSDSVKNRLVLENDDVCYTVHDLLPVCEELNIPFVLDYHHHNILFDSDKIREGTADIVDLYPRIFATWERKGITPKMHYSEQTPPAITGKQRRKHNPRPWTLPPCPPNSDLMIEAKDKEQAVFELMRTFKLPGFDSFADIIPYERFDDNKVADSAAGQRKIAKGETIDLVPEEEIGMGGPEGRVYWPLGMEEWLRPKKREVKKKEEPEEKDAKKKEKLKKEAEKFYAERQAALNGDGSAVKQEEEEDSDADATPATKKAKAAMKKKDAAAAAKAAAKVAQAAAKEVKAAPAKKSAPAKKGGARKKAAEVAQPTPSASDEEEEEELSLEDEDSDEGPVTPGKRPQAATGAKRQSGRGRAKVSYVEAGGDDEDTEMS